MKETQQKNKGSAKKTQPEHLQKNKLEWIVFAISSLLLLALIGYLCYDAFTHKISTPDLKVSYSKDPSQHNPNRFKIQLENLGGETAEDIIIEASLLQADSVVEKSELHFPFSPKQSKTEGWVNFSVNPVQADSLFVRVTSYKKP